MKVLSINFADTGNHLGDKAIQALKKKYSKPNDEVKLIELGAPALDMLQTHESAFHDDEILTQTAKDIQQFKPDHILIGVHGNIDNTTDCFHHHENGSQKLANPQTFAQLIYQLTNEITPNLTLLMCYGARTDQYLEDHAQDNRAFATSFAYKFIKHLRELSKNKTIHLDACTGAISFDSQTGNLLVENETRIMLNEEKKPYIMHFRDNLERLNVLQNAFILHSEKKFTQYMEEQDYLNDKSERGNRLRLEEARFDFLEKVELLDETLSVPKKSKECGIISFTSDDKGLRYSRKYDDKKVHLAMVDQYAERLKTIANTTTGFQSPDPPPYQCQII